MVKFLVDGNQFNSVDELTKLYILDQVDLMVLEAAANTIDDGVEMIKVDIKAGVKIHVIEVYG